MFLIEGVGRGQGPPSTERQERWKLISLGTLVPFQGTLLNDVFNGHILKWMQLYYWVGKRPSSSLPCLWSCHSWRCWCVLLSTELQVPLFITLWEGEVPGSNLSWIWVILKWKAGCQGSGPAWKQSLPLSRCQGRPSVDVVMVIKGFRTCHNFGRISPQKKLT